MKEQSDILITVTALVTFQHFAEEEKLERKRGIEVRRDTCHDMPLPISMFSSKQTQYISFNAFCIVLHSNMLEMRE